jgi:Concanavalin A-like lectin/glucanases superfamily
VSVTHSFRCLLLVLAVCSAELVASPCQAGAFVRGAYYRLGEDDPGATPIVLGNDPTIDSFSDHLDLARFGSPHYSADVPSRGPNSKLSMQFGATAGPTVPGYYGRTDPLLMDQQGYALETWVKAAPTNLDGSGVADGLIAYNGTPGTDGFGFFESGGYYVARLGSFDRILGPAETSVWHHLAYVYSFGNEGYYYDGQLVLQTIKDPTALAAKGGFWLGGETDAALPAIQDYAFSGWIDEVRYQSFNPIAAGAFEPTNFLITVPEPSTAGLLLAFAAIVVTRRFRKRTPAG